MSPELQSHFFNLYAIALADTEFNEKEVSLMYELAEEKGISREEMDALILNSSSTPPVYPETIVEKIEYLYDYARIILADGIVHDEEVKSLQKFCLKFQFAEQNVSTISELLIEAARNGISKEDVLTFVTQNN
jgi:uncharacterized tellurite resistance protein B-like protein